MSIVAGNVSSTSTKFYSKEQLEKTLYKCLPASMLKYFILDIVNYGWDCYPPSSINFPIDSIQMKCLFRPQKYRHLWDAQDVPTYLDQTHIGRIGYSFFIPGAMEAGKEFVIVWVHPLGKVCGIILLPKFEIDIPNKILYIDRDKDIDAVMSSYELASASASTGASTSTSSDYPVYIMNTQHKGRGSARVFLCSPDDKNDKDKDKFVIKHKSIIQGDSIAYIQPGCILTWEQFFRYCESCNS
jgi:hypothetical protein